jgi:hypothetical protein
LRTKPWEFICELLISESKCVDGMDLPAEYVLHLLPLMAVCGLPPPQQHVSSPGERRGEKAGVDQLASSTPTLASIPYIDATLGHAILKLIDQWRTLALWEPFASKERQIPGASLEGMFRVIPVDRVPLWLTGLMNRLSDCRLKKLGYRWKMALKRIRNLILLCRL